MQQLAQSAPDAHRHPVPDDQDLGGRILVVDDDRSTRSVHRAMLAKRFDVVTAASGEEALAICAEHLPDLIVLDVEMPGMDGYETCRRLREQTNIPIVFVTAHQTLEEHLKAYDAGGNVLFTKPVSHEILLRKVALSIRQHRAAAALADEKTALERMAMGFLSSASQTGLLLNFMRASVVCRDYSDLALHLRDAVANLGLQCIVRITHDGGPTVVTDQGEASPLELSIFDHLAEIGRVFQFKRRLVVNYDRVSIIVSNMPLESDDPERCGLLRDSLAILAETGEALAMNVDIRKEGQQKAEQLQIALSGAEQALYGLAENNRSMLLDSRLLLQELVDSIEKSYSWLNTSQAQETAISSTMAQAVQRIIERLTSGADFDAQFAHVLSALNAGRSQHAVELF